MKHTIASVFAGGLVCLSASLALAADPAPAPPPAHPHGMHGHPRGHHGPPTAAEITEHMQKDLDLSPEQLSKVRAINEEHVAEMAKLHPTEKEMQARMEQMSKLRDKQAAELRAVLTEEQYARFSKQREERDMRMMKHHHAPEPE